MSYALSALGEEAVTQSQPVDPTTPAAPITRHSEPPVSIALKVMAVAAVPWVPVFGGAWLGKRWGGADGKWIGALGGFALSVAVLSSVERQMRGA